MEATKTKAKTPPLKSPYQWFGGKSKIMPAVWKRFGVVANFVDPFAGSMASVLCRPLTFDCIETVNDANPFVGNFWRCVQRDPLKLALEADRITEETYLHATGDAIFYRDDWYAARGMDLRAGFRSRMDTDADFCNYEVGGLWVAGLCEWIGDNWSEGSHSAKKDADGEAVACTRALPHLGNAGQGVNRQLPHLGDAGQGVKRQRPHLAWGQGVNRKLPHLGNAGRGWLNSLSFGSEIVEVLNLWPSITSRTWMLFEYFAQLAERFRRVRVCCGDWRRVCGETPTVKLGMTAVFLDPPYCSTDRDSVYGTEEDFGVAHDVRAWCLENGDNPLLRIALCGYAAEHDELEAAGWDVLAWKTRGGYGSRGNNTRGAANAKRERIWFSPHCLKPQTNRTLF